MNEERSGILLVTQDAELIRNVESSLNAEFSISHISSITEAYAKIAFSLPILIICETDLNGENGFDFCASIRKGVKTKLIPFIFISSSSKIDDRIKAIQQGADAYLVRPLNIHELNAYIRSKISQFNEFYELSVTDELTRLYNRREFLKKFSTEIEMNPEKVISLSIIDLDFFKQVNDVHGHQTGDLVLMEFANIRKKHSGPDVIPTRFGGEEFVILFLGISSYEAKVRTDHIREDFHAIKFHSTSNRTFHVSFSAGISEYPTLGSNISILLSRADQALYSAKKDGRSRTYIFNPVMARNDRFWEYLKKSKGFFLDKYHADSVTKLPFLPAALELISSDYLVSSIGCIVLKIKTLIDIKKHFGTTNYDYCIENLKFIITKSCEHHFASDTYISVSDIFDYEFIILFPSIIDFSLNFEKCRALYNDIVQDIAAKSENYPLFLSYSSSVIYYDKNDPRKILSDISNIRQDIIPLDSKSEIFNSQIFSLYAKICNNEDVSDFFRIDHFIHIKNNNSSFLTINLYDSKCSFISLSMLLISVIKTESDLASFLSALVKIIPQNEVAPLIIPYIDTINFRVFCDITSRITGTLPIRISINESLLDDAFIAVLNEVSMIMPETVGFAIDNCYVGNNILNIITLADFKLVIFSDFSIKDIHYFKERIKILNGLKVFLEQIDIPVCVRNICTEEEFQIISDLSIEYAAGPYITKTC